METIPQERSTIGQGQVWTFVSLRFASFRFVSFSFNDKSTHMLLSNFDYILPIEKLLFFFPRKNIRSNLLLFAAQRKKRKKARRKIKNARTREEKEEYKVDVEYDNLFLFLFLLLLFKLER